MIYNKKVLKKEKLGYKSLNIASEGTIVLFQDSCDEYEKENDKKN